MLITAAILILLTCIAHSYLGERYILTRLFRRELPKLFGDDSFTKGVLRFCWHLLSVVWLGMAVILVMAAGAPESDFRTGSLMTIGIVMLLSAPFPLVLTRGRHLSWVMFMLIGGLTLASVY